MGYDVMSHLINAVLKLNRIGTLVRAYSVEHFAELANFNRLLLCGYLIVESRKSIRKFLPFPTCAKNSEPLHVVTQNI